MAQIPGAAVVVKSYAICGGLGVRGSNMDSTNGCIYLQSFRHLKFKFFWPRPGNGHDMALDLVSGANFRCVLYHCSSLTRWSGSRGQDWPENNRKIQNLNYNFCSLA